MNRFGFPSKETTSWMVFLLAIPFLCVLFTVIPAAQKKNSDPQSKKGATLSLSRARSLAGRLLVLPKLLPLPRRRHQLRVAHVLRVLGARESGARWIESVPEVADAQKPAGPVLFASSFFLIWVFRRKLGDPSRWAVSFWFPFKTVRTLV